MEESYSKRQKTFKENLQDQPDDILFLIFSFLMEPSPRIPASITQLRLINKLWKKKAEDFCRKILAFDFASFSSVLLRKEDIKIAQSFEKNGVFLHQRIHHQT